MKKIKSDEELRNYIFLCSQYMLKVKKILNISANIKGTKYNVNLEIKKQ